MGKTYAQMSFRFSPEEAQSIRRLAEAVGMPMARLIVELVRAAEEKLKAQKGGKK